MNRAKLGSIGTVGIVRRICRGAVVPLAAAALLLGAGAPAQPPAAAVAGAPAGQPTRVVDLDASFQIPLDKEHRKHGVSHTPAVLYTVDGKRMITATADKELIVFDARSKKLLHSHKLEQKATDAVALDAAGRIGAWVLEGGGIVVLDSESGKILGQDAKARAKWIALSPDGKRLAYSRGAEVVVCRVDDIALERTLADHKSEVTNIAWSRDGKWLGATAKDGRLIVVSAEDGKKVCEVSKKGALYALDFHPTERAVAFGGDERQVYQLYWETGKEIVVTQGQPFWITCVGYSPDGKRIALGDESCDVWMYDLDKPGKHQFHSKHHVECWLTQVAWTPDSETFLFGCRPNTHAGKPALYAPLRRAEAARQQNVRDSRKQVLDAVDQELKNAKDEPARQALSQLRESLNHEEELAAHEGYGLQQQMQINVGAMAGPQTGSGQAPATTQPAITPNGGVGVPQQQVVENALSNQVQAGLGRGGRPAIDLKSLPENVRKSLEKHNTNFSAAEQELGKNFQINGWKVQSQK